MPETTGMVYISTYRGYGIYQRDIPCGTFAIMEGWDFIQKSFSTREECEACIDKMKEGEDKRKMFQFLRDNLSIDISKNRDWGCNQVNITVKLNLTNPETNTNETISEQSFSVG